MAHVYVFIVMVLKKTNWFSYIYITMTQSSLTFVVYWIFELHCNKSKEAMVHVCLWEAMFVYRNRLQ